MNYLEKSHKVLKKSNADCNGAQTFGFVADKHTA